MEKEMEKALNELIERLDEQGFFEKYCRLVCPGHQRGICDHCPMTKIQIMEMWACNTDVFESVKDEVYDLPKEEP